MLVNSEQCQSCRDAFFDDGVELLDSSAAIEQNSEIEKYNSKRNANEKYPYQGEPRQGRRILNGFDVVVTHCFMSAELLDSIAANQPELRDSKRQF